MTLPQESLLSVRNEPNDSVLTKSTKNLRGGEERVTSNFADTRRISCVY